MTKYPHETALPAYTLRLFDSATNVTTDSGLSDEMKTFYSGYLIDNAGPELVHDQFGQRQPIPLGGGKTIEFRKYEALSKALTPLTEGVTPGGKKLSVGKVTAEVKQYGDFIELSDVLLLTAVDNNLVQATELLGAQAGQTMDTVTREVLNGGTNVQYAEGQVNARNLLTADHKLTVKACKLAARYLKTQNAKKIDGNWVAIIHPDCAYDLTEDPEWKYPHQYQDTSEIYAGEIGKVAGIRFVETTEAKIFTGADLASDSRNLTVNGAVSSGTAVNFDGGTVAPNALVGRKVQIGDAVVGVTANTATQLTVDAAVTAADNALIYPGEGGKDGRDVYSTLVLGANAYGVTEVTGGGLQHIVKQLGSAGTSDPLNQRATAGWKSIRTAERLVEPYMVRIETASSFSDGKAN